MPETETTFAKDWLRPIAWPCSRNMRGARASRSQSPVAKPWYLGYQRNENEKRLCVQALWCGGLFASCSSYQVLFHTRLTLRCVLCWNPDSSLHHSANHSRAIEEREQLLLLDHVRDLFPLLCCRIDTSRVVCTGVQQHNRARRCTLHIWRCAVSQVHQGMLVSVMI